MGPMNNIIQSLSVDMLQVLISRGEIDDISLETIQATVVGKLYFSIHTGRLDLQNKLLHLLHSVISASTALYPSTSKAITASPALSQGRSTRGSQDGGRPDKGASPLLIQTLVDGISVPQNRPLYQHWLDFVLMTIPQFQNTLRTTIGPLIDCICRRLRMALTDLSQVFVEGRAGIANKQLALTDAELVMYLNALERLVLLSLSNRASPAQLEDDGIAIERGIPEPTGLFGYVSTVFGTEENAPAQDEQLTVSCSTVFWPGVLK